MNHDCSFSCFPWIKRGLPLHTSVGPSICLDVSIRAEVRSPRHEEEV